MSGWCPQDLSVQQKSEPDDVKTRKEAGKKNKARALNVQKGLKNDQIRQTNS